MEEFFQGAMVPLHFFASVSWERASVSSSAMWTALFVLYPKATPFPLKGQELHVALKSNARELSDRIKAKATLDWTERDAVRADMRRTVRRLLAKHGYPPDAQEAVTQLVIKQAELMAKDVNLAKWFY